MVLPLGDLEKTQIVPIATGIVTTGSASFGAGGVVPPAFFEPACRRVRTFVCAMIGALRPKIGFPPV